MTALGEIERLVDAHAQAARMDGAAWERRDGAALRKSEVEFVDTRLALLALITRALADRDERIAALEADLADKDTAMVLAQNAAERRGKRVTALEAGLRKDCDSDGSGH